MQVFWENTESKDLTGLAHSSRNAYKYMYPSHHRCVTRVPTLKTPGKQRPLPIKTALCAGSTPMLSYILLA